MLLPSVFHQMDRMQFIFQSFEIQSDTDPPRTAAPVGVEFHAVSLDFFDSLVDLRRRSVRLG